MSIILLYNVCVIPKEKFFRQLRKHAEQKHLTADSENYLRFLLSGRAKIIVKELLKTKINETETDE